MTEPDAAAVDTAAPEHLHTYHPCGVCPRASYAPHNSVLVPPDGPQPCEVLFIGEGPAKDEAKQLTPFVGDTGQDFDYHLLPLAHTSRPRVRVGNAVLCTFPKHRNPTPEEGQACLRRHLGYEIRRTRPTYLVVMGAVACHTLAPWATLARDYGLASYRSIDWLDWEGWVVPMYHPAAGMYDSRMALQVQEAFLLLRDILAGSTDRPVDAYPDRSSPNAPHGDDLYRAGRYRLLTGDTEVLEVVRNYDTMALDTEYGMKGPKQPHCLSFSQQPGTGYMILASDTEALATLNEYLHVDRVAPERFLFHSVFADHRRLAQMGVHIPWSRLHDTIVDAYNLGLSSQSLKILSYRLLGCHMDDFTDVVGVYNLDAALTYLERIVDLGGNEYWRPRQPWLGPRQRTLGSKAATAISNALNRDSDPIRIWEGWPEPDRDLATSLLGPFPDLGLACAPMDKQIPYSCRDADLALRLAPVLAREIAQLRRRLNA